MDPATISAVILAVATIIGLVVAYRQWRENHSDRLGGKLDTKIKALVAEVNKPFGDQLHDHAIRFTQDEGRLGRIEDMLKEIAIAGRKTSDEMIEVRVKLSMVGTAVESMAINAAKNLHQPDPLRRHVDKLLEAFMEGTLTDDERNELRKVLVDIRNFEAKGNTEENRQLAIEQLGFPVFPGEQTAATILLSTMDLVDPRKMSMMGHSSHRTPADSKEADRE